MRRPVDRGQLRAVHARAEEPIYALHGQVTCSPANDEDGDLDCSERRRRKRETIGACPIEDIDRRRLDGVGANPWWPGGEGVSATVKVDHCLDRFLVPTLKGGEICLRHLTECAV